MPIKGFKTSSPNPFRLFYIIKAKYDWWNSVKKQNQKFKIKVTIFLSA